MFNNIYFAIASPDSRKAHFLEAFSGNTNGNNVYSILIRSQQFFYGLYT